MPYIVWNGVESAQGGCVTNGAKGASKKKCSLIMDFFQKGLTPPSPPPDFRNFWDTFL